MNREELFNQLFEDPNVVRQVQAMSDPEEIRSFLASHGVEFSQDEMEQLLLGIGEAMDNRIAEGELDENELESVAGGFTMTLTLGAGAALAAGTLGFVVGVGGVIALGYFGYKYYKKLKKK